jgi:hypothetical protein
LRSGGAQQEQAAVDAVDPIVVFSLCLVLVLLGILHMMQLFSN